MFIRRSEVIITTEKSTNRAVRNLYDECFFVNRTLYDEPGRNLSSVRNTRLRGFGNE